MKRGRPIVLVLLLAFSGCASLSGLPPEAQQEGAIFALCSSFKTELRVANTFEPQMTEEQRVVVDRAVDVIQPACHAARAGEQTTEETLRAVRNALRDVVVANQEVRQ